VIMYHGSLVERNGLNLAVAAMNRVRRTIAVAELRIYGRRTPFLEQVMEQVRDEGLEDYVSYLGPKRLEDLVSAIENCDVGIIPNQQNAFTDINTPTRIFEYLALGKPVIAPRTAGIQDYFNDDSLLFFDSGNVEGLAEIIEYSFSHTSESLEIARRGQEVYMAHTWPQEKNNLVNLVNRLFGRTEIGDGSLQSREFTHSNS
jgi:glycosyltransferase involved in cell wall biosynthesis